VTVEEFGGGRVPMCIWCTEPSCKFSYAKRATSNKKLVYYTYSRTQLYL